jgi:HD-like signal output (HDOD) protein
VPKVYPDDLILQTDMPIDPELRSLDIDVPARPDALVQLSLLLADDAVNLEAVGALVESDMSLAAAVMKAINSSLYGLKGRVQSVQQAVSYLGTREVAGIAFEMGLRAAFPAAPELEPVWSRAALRGLWMGRMAQALDLDAWAAHSAGLFEECGKAVLFRHAPEHYRAMLRAADSDPELCQIERTGFGVSHDALGAALCESWGLGQLTVSSVRHHVEAQDTHVFEGALPRRRVLALSVFVGAMMQGSETLDELAAELGPAVELDSAALLRAGRRLMSQLEDAA